MAGAFRVALTRDFLTADGRIGWGEIGLDALTSTTGVSWEFLTSETTELPPSVGMDYDALIVLSPTVSATTLSAADRLKVVARFGVGYDNIDVAACTTAGVLLTITPDGVRRPVAVAAVSMMLALTHRIRNKDLLVRNGRWHDKLDYMGTSPTGRALGLLGWGNIGREITTLCAPLGMRQLATDPYADPTTAAAAAVQLCSIDRLFAESDIIIVTCALTPETHHLVNADRLAAMKRSAFLVNVARGPIVDEEALTAVLANRHIAGAALDVFESEPPDPNHPLLGLDNVLLAPHAIAWTDQLAFGNGSSAIRAVLDVATGVVPAYPVNPGALRHPKLSMLKARSANEHHQS
ncbi:NAD(P)-dependent oxidoreductase [Actinopolymorpha sp. B11F2]|uniref:NAD(P)-dependent oxidoreductase n=1 Tax=Actinopolymorpha sp. B11F2 TaxID=3160862 RepID=UPI0032E52646